MRKINVADRAQIKQILRARGVLGIANDRQQQSGAVQCWWHDIEGGVCNCCESHWPDTAGQIDRVTLSEALKTLWNNRSSLYLCGKHPHGSH